MNMKPIDQSTIPVITIDGPAGAGKGTLTQALAEYLNWHTLDSGAIYRVVALQALRLGLDLNDEASVVAAIEPLRIQFSPVGIFLNEKEVSAEIRHEGCATATSRISALPQVRQALLALQRSYQQAPGLVADGRDMGTVVFPTAHLKFYLTANVQCRAERRFKQLIELGINASLSALIDEISQRDERDANRAIAPLKPATDAIVLDTSNMNSEQVLREVLDIYHRNA